MFNFYFNMSIIEQQFQKRWKKMFTVTFGQSFAIFLVFRLINTES